MNKVYYFPPYDFDANGRRVSDGVPFREIVKEFERDFHLNHSHRYEHLLFANSRTMLLLSRSCDAKENLIYGSEVIDDYFIDPHTNHLIEEASTKEYIVVYGIDSAFMPVDKDGIALIDYDKKIFPLALLIDDNLSDGIIILIYKDDDDSRDDERVNEPVDIEELIHA